MCLWAFMKEQQNNIMMFWNVLKWFIAKKTNLNTEDIRIDNTAYMELPIPEIECTTFGQQ